MHGNILIVDDDHIIVESCKRVLMTEGVAVTATTSSQAALDLIKNNDYDVVVTDIYMPEFDGFDLIKHIKAVKPATGIVVITGYASQQNVRDVVALGIIDYLQKPFTPTMLVELVGRALHVAKKIKSIVPVTLVEEDTESKSAELLSLIDKYKGKPGSLIVLLEKTQELIGYLPPSVQKIIAKGLKIPVSEVHSVVSFYPYFTMKVRGVHNIKVCVGAACYARKANEIMDTLRQMLNFNEDNVTGDRRFSIETVRCLGACGFAPVVEIDHDTHGAVEPEKIPDILKDYN